MNNVELINAMPFNPHMKTLDFMPRTGDIFPFTPNVATEPVSFTPSETYEVQMARNAIASCEGIKQAWLAFRNGSTEAVQRGLLPPNFNPLCKIEREDMMRTINDGVMTVVEERG